MKKVNWKLEAKRILKSEMVKKGVTYSLLTNLLNQIGIDENEDSMESKVRRGTFRASFLLQCLKVLNCNHVNVEVEIPLKKKSD